MSSQLIEAKFQALDRTIRLLHRTATIKISSSEQLRELVYTQRAAVVAAAAASKASSTATATTTPLGPKPPRSNAITPRVRPSSGHPSTPRSTAAKTSDRPRTAAASLATTPRPPPGDLRVRSPPCTTRSLEESNGNVTGMPDEKSFKSACSISGTTTTSKKDEHKGAPTSDGAGNKGENVTEPTSPNASDSSPTEDCRRSVVQALQKRTAMDHPPERKTPIRNWFAPAPGLPKTPRKSKRTINNAVAVPATTATANYQEAPTTDTTQDNAEGPNSLVLQDIPAQCNDPSFYFLEVRLEHPAPLVNWRFRATFTDISLLARPSVTVDNVPADMTNCLLFSTINPVGPPVITKYFDPVRYFAHVKKPRDLYGHCIRIIVHSIHPIQRVVIDTVVHFLVDDSPSAPHPFPSPQRQLNKLRQETTNVQSPTKPQHQDHLQHDDTETESCSGWAEDEDKPASTPSIEPSPNQSPSRSRAFDGGLTVEKKKIELKKMRATMRRKLNEEMKQLSADGHR